MRLWRVSTHERFDGEGARRLGGRWNRPGTAVIYAAATLALATLEFVVHLGRSRVRRAIYAHHIDVPNDISIRRVEEDDLPAGWRTVPAPGALREIGTSWIHSGSTALLDVPSAVLRVSPKLVPSERNYLLAPAHPDFTRIGVRSVTLELDPRMWH